LIFVLPLAFTICLLHRSSNRAHSSPVANVPTEVPFFDLDSPDFDVDEFEQTYRDYHAVHVRNAAKTGNVTQKGSKRGCFRWQDVGSIFKKLNNKDKESWCVETKTAVMTPDKFLVAENTQDRAYCSFLVQNDADTYEDAIKRLPFQEFPSTDWKYEPALWVFFGRNPIGHTNLDGRPEHTDAVTHDGTWHYQLSGVKRWFLRPTPELIATCRRQQQDFPTISQDSCLQVECQEGDVLVVNTRLWFHRTVIPPQSCPSVSYARDFSFGDLPTVEAASAEGGMTNVDGLYATNDIACGTIIFTEVNTPDCELHRSSTNPNCEVVELEDGTSAVVSIRAIASGEFFCVPESSEEESEGDFDDEEEM
jgi:hypothetical protein